MISSTQSFSVTFFSRFVFSIHPLSFWIQFHLPPMDWVNWPFNALSVALWLFAFLLHLRLMKMPHTIMLMMSTASTTGTRMMMGFKASSSPVPSVGSSNAGSCKEIVSQTPNVSTFSNKSVLVYYVMLGLLYHQNSLWSLSQDHLLQCFQGRQCFQLEIEQQRGKLYLFIYFICWLFSQPKHETNMGPG